jgi:hypothetical protein
LFDGEKIGGYQKSCGTALLRRKNHQNRSEKVFRKKFKLDLTYQNKSSCIVNTYPKITSQKLSYYLLNFKAETTNQIFVVSLSAA